MYTGNIVNASFDLVRKMLNIYGTLHEIDEVDVGTAEKEVVYQRDSVTLLRFKPVRKSANLPPLLIIYSFVNRPYMLDLQPDRSMIRNLLNEGLEIYLIDTGYPKLEDRFLSLDDYINSYFDDCVEVVREISGYNKITMVGICQGGVMALIYTALHQDKISTLIPIVTPVDFSIDDAILYGMTRYINADKLVDSFGIIPGEMMMESLMILKPFFKVYKYLTSLDLMQDYDKTLNFLRMERWLFDTPGLAGECNRQFVKDIYQANKLVKGGLKVGNNEVNLKKITVPLLNIYAAYDHIVPPSSSIVLNDLVGSKIKHLFKLETGHIGVFVGSKAQTELAAGMMQWLKKYTKY